MSSGLLHIGLLQQRASYSEHKALLLQQQRADKYLNKEFSLCDQNKNVTLKYTACLQQLLALYIGLYLIMMIKIVFNPARMHGHT